MNNHVKRIHFLGSNETYLCEPCNMNFMNEEKFTEHARNVHDEKHENVEIKKVSDLTIDEEKKSIFMWYV